MKWLNEKEWRIVWWAMLVIMLIYLGYSLVRLSEEGAYQYCVPDNSSGVMNVTCYKDRWVAQNHADALNRDKNLGYNYINNYTQVPIWDK